MKTTTIRNLKGALAAMVALAAAPVAAAEFVVSLQDIDCQSCGAEVCDLLEDRAGVLDASFDRDTAEITVEVAADGPDPEEIVALIHRAGHSATLGAGKGRYLEAIDFDDGLDIEWISRLGEAVDIESQLVAGKVTVVDFYADWCGPCREVDKAMREILAAADDVALRKINVVDWQSPIARQELAHVSALPYVRVYGKDGKRLASISGLDLKRLHKVIDKGRRQ